MEQEIETLRQQLKQQEKLASLGMLSAGIAHEIQNPLNFVINFSKMSTKLLSDLNDIMEDNEEKLSDDDRQERAISIIQGILLVSRGKEGEMLPTDICRLTKEYVWLSYHAMRANHKGFNLSIHEDYQDGLPMMMVIPQDLSRAILNLMNNACYTVWNKSQTAGDEYKPEVTVSVKQADNHIVITLKDNGEGMSDEVKERLYENFFTTKPVGQGTGLGMAITRDIIENRHHGTISFESTEGKGTTFTLTIPIKK